MQKILIRKAKNLLNIFNRFYSIFIQNISLRFSFLNFKFRILNIDVYVFLKLNAENLNKYKLAKSFDDLVLRMFELINNSKINIYLWRKFLFLLNYSSNRSFYINFVEDYFLKFNFDFNKLPNLTPYLVDPFYLVGDYKTADKINLILRNKKDKFFERDVGLYEERSHLTAIGHLCLFSYYLKSRELNFLGEDSSSFLFNRKNISNNLFFQIIHARAKKLNVLISETEKKLDYFNQEDHEMDLWPCKMKNKYIFAGSIHGLVEEQWQKVYKTKKFFNLSNEMLIRAEELLRQKNILQTNKWFIGMHLRTTQDKRKLRNADFKNIFHICDEVQKQGGEVIFTGTYELENISKRKSITFLNELDITRTENELMQLYVWSRASFFVGNLSGGTIPPSLFGTPIIWIDSHPTVHRRPASQEDTIIPKRIFDLKNQKFLTFNEANSDEHFMCQSDNEFLAEIAGYKVMSSDLKIIDQVIKFYISKYVYKKEILENDFFERDHYLPTEKGAFYKF